MIATRRKIYKRCEYCGDSQKDPSKRHMAIFVDSGYFRCYRCGIEGYLPIAELVEMVFHEWGDNHSMRPVQSNERPLRPLDSELVFNAGPNPRYNRFSHVRNRYHLLHPKSLDIFEIKDPHGSTQGYALRDISVKTMRTILFGKMGFGYFPQKLPSSRVPIRIVEGPYDVVTEHDVCTFGIPRSGQIAQLQFQPIILCPDGDVWNRLDLLRAWLLPWKSRLVVGVERLPQNLDPDEVPVGDRETLTYGEALGLMKQLEYQEKEKDAIWG